MDNYPKIVSDVDLFLQLLNRKNQTIVFTNGCFDLLHEGHLHLLKEAKKLGNILIVAVNADDSIKRLKGNSRPIYSGKWRSVPYVGMPGNSTGNQGNVWYIPYIVDSTHIVTDIGIEVTTAIAATNIRLALYDDNNGVPGSLIEESAAISSDSTGLKTHTFATPKTLSASNQIYWMAFQCSAFGVGVRATSTAVNNLYITGIGAIGSVYSQSQAFGAFPANATPVNFSSSASWLVSLKVQ